MTNSRTTAGPPPAIIQGGMGVAISTWRLARSVASCGQLGTVSGTALAVVLARRLQQGDPDGAMRRALTHLPLPDVAGRVLDRYFVPGGIAVGRPFKAVPRPTVEQRAAFTELTVAANFVEVYLAKEGHAGPVAVNHLHKVRLPTPAGLYGALLAGVDYVAMGAGIPRDIPTMLDALAAHEPVTLRVPVMGDRTGDATDMHFDPRRLWQDDPGATPRALRRPRFLAIVASATLAHALARDPATCPDGFVIEGPGAGGHNAPPRGKLRLDPTGQPLYGPRDAVDPAAVARLGVPFWLAGGYGTPEGLTQARACGAAGVQVGTLFALCAESGLAGPLKAALLAQVRAGNTQVRTDPSASPTGFPFKIAALDGTLSDPTVRDARSRVCDLGFLSEAYRRTDGTVAYRCAAEPEADYTRKGGELADATGRLCLCNALTATAGLSQRRASSVVEPAVVTAGDGLAAVATLLADGRSSYTAADVLDHLIAT